MFIYFWDKERQSMNRGGSEREGDTESKTGSRHWAVSTEPDMGLELTDWDHDLSRSRTLNRLSHPGAPHSFKVYSFVESWSCHHSQYESSFITPKRYLLPIGISSSFLPSPLAQALLMYFPSRRDLLILGISSKKSYSKRSFVGTFFDFA